MFSRCVNDLAHLASLYITDRVAKLGRVVWLPAILSFPVGTLCFSLLRLLWATVSSDQAAGAETLSWVSEYWLLWTIYLTPVYLGHLALHALIFIVLQRLFPSRYRLALAVSIGLFVIYPLAALYSNPLAMTYLFGFVLLFVYTIVWNEILERRERAGLPSMASHGGSGMPVKVNRTNAMDTRL